MITGCGTAYLKGAMNSGYGTGGFDADPPQWVIAGKVCTFEEFVNTLYPDDCAEKTLLILRLQGESNDTSSK